MQEKRKLFIPVCLYSQSAYRRKDNIDQLLTLIAQRDEGAFILIADFVHVFFLLLTSKSDTFEEAMDKAKQDGANVHRMIENRLSRLGGEIDVLLSYWSDVSACKDYLSLKERVVNAAIVDEKFANVVKVYGEKSLEKLRIRKTEKHSGYERNYLLNEVAMSLYVSEVMGYPIEIWENKPLSYVSDPITYLYTENRNLLKTLAGKDDLQRVQKYVDLKSEKLW